MPSLPCLALSCLGIFFDEDGQPRASDAASGCETEARTGDRQLREWEESVRVKTFFCSSRSEKEVLAMSDESDNVFVVARHLYSVTACTPEEEKQKKELMEALDPEIATLIQLFPRLFQPPDAVPPERSVKHHITLKPNALPIRRAPYVVGEDKLRAMKEQIQQLQKQGWIEPSSAPWGSPVLFVPKKEKVFRMCGDFRDLNVLTVDDSFRCLEWRSSCIELEGLPRSRNSTWRRVSTKLHSPRKANPSRRFACPSQSKGTACGGGQ